MPQTTASSIGHIHALLANKRYSVNDLADNVLRVEEVESGVSLRAVLEGDILFLSLDLPGYALRQFDTGSITQNAGCGQRHLDIALPAL